MSTSPYWPGFLAQVLMRGAGWLLIVFAVAHLARRQSAARRALAWQMAFSGMLLLPIAVLWLPAVPLLPTSEPVRTSDAPKSPPPVAISSTRSADTRYAAALSPETEWKALNEFRITGLTFDMTSAPSANGPSRLRRSVLDPGQSVLGYFLTAFVVPRVFDKGRPAVGRFQITQPVRLGLGEAEQLDTVFESGALDLQISDADKGG